MPNKENIPSHMAMIKELAEDDVCYLVLCEGNKNVLEIFNTKYYVPSSTDFVERGERYYLTENDN